ncbi:MAG TPA: DNA replication/repair protein RecF [Cyclobacteriaceae bacterium]
MRIEKIHLSNFKNYPTADLDVSAKVNVLVGRNGSGKTNLLDAIHYLSFTRSAFQSSDFQNIRHGENYFFIKGQISVDARLHEITCGVQQGLKKNFRNENAEYQKISDHIGKYPVVLMAPDDVDLVKEGSESRRKFFDSMISQIDKVYLENLIQYNYALKQRNSLLKMFQETGKTDWLALEMYDNTLIPQGEAIHLRRKEFVTEFIPTFRRFYNFLVDECEITNLNYLSGLSETRFADGLLKNRNKDLALLRTSFGIHRDDFEFTLGSGDLKRLGSQGQQKSFVIALKMAQADVIRNHKGFNPVLLLDDIFDKLDDHRISRLLELIKNDASQLFISDARPDRTQGLLKQIKVEASVFIVESGNITHHV